MLGTATFGSDYGIANQNNVMSEAEVSLVLQRAFELGIKTLDTSPEYGKAEILIGQYQSKNEKFKIFSKFRLERDFQSTIESIKQSRDNLKIKQFEGLYFHRPNDLLTRSRDENCRLINELVNSGLTKRIGASVYDEDEIHRISSTYPEIKLFQVPENILDRRLLKSSLVEGLASNGYEFHIRSIFMQGLILMDTSRLHPKFGAFTESLIELKKFARSTNMSVEEICISYAKQISWAKSILIGASKAHQIHELCTLGATKLDFDTLPKAMAPELVDPRGWVE